MRTFNDAIDQLEHELQQFTYEKTLQNNSRAEFKVSMFDEGVNILLLKTSLTGSERSKPQIRVFTERIVQQVERSLENNERFFCFIHCSHDAAELKFRNIQPRDYVVSLESDWRTAGGRIDVRSVYDFLEENPTTRYKKLNKSQHSARSILQATIFKQTDHGFENLEHYLRFFDSRLVSRADTIGATQSDDLEDETIAQATLVNHGLNKIYFGAPGTGKSFRIQTFIRDNGIPDYDEKKGHPNVFRTTLHPEFTYYDFVGQVMPAVSSQETNDEATRIEYKFVPNIFSKALAYAKKVENSEPVFLILEEMSRANVAAVFGDLFQLLDRDSDTGESEYRINNDLISHYVFNDDRQIYLPRNLFIIGTVNTNDQNVFVMDTAFKRRFEFEYVNANAIAFDESGQPLNNYRLTLKNHDEEIEFEWMTLYRALNRFITKKVESGGLGLKEDKQLGQFFIKFRKNDDDYNFNQIKGKLLQYLYDDVEAVSYASTSLFKANISSFGEAYTQLSNSENIFSDAFIGEYEALEKMDSSEGL